MGSGIFQKVGILKMKGNHIKKVGITEIAIIGAIVLTFLPMCENDTTYGVVEASLAGPLCRYRSFYARLWAWVN